MSIYVRSLTKEEKRELEDIARNGSDVKYARRAMVILASSRGIPVMRIAEILGYNDVQVRRIIHIFDRGGIEGLRPQYRGGHPYHFTKEQRRAVVELAECRPRDLGFPLSQWSLSQLQTVLIKQKKMKYISRPTIRTILLEAGITKQRTKTWKESDDPLFEKKKNS